MDFFFILSGFILTYNYRRIEGPSHAVRVVLYRIARIWPLHIAALILWFVIARNPQKAFAGLDTIWANLLLIQAWSGSYYYAFSGNAPSWTLSVELAFYIAFPALLLMRSAPLIVLTMAVTAATMWWAMIVPNPASFTDNAPSTGAILRTHPGAFFVLFSGGILTARLFMSRTWRVGRFATPVEIVCLVVAIWFFLDSRAIAAVAEFLSLPRLWSMWLGHALATVFFAPLLFMLAIGEGFVSKVLSVRSMVFLGEISFAMYLVHQPIQFAMMQHGVAKMAHAPLYIGVILVVAAFCHYVVEKPAQRTLRRWFDALTSRPAQVDV